MEELIKLVKIINKRGVTEANLLDFKNKRPQKEWMLYNGLATGEITTEEEAVSVLYTEGTAKNGFKMLKSRLRKRLLNQLFFLEYDEPNQGGALAAENDCLMKIYQARVLLNAGAYDLAGPILRDVIAQGQKYSFYELVSMAQRSLLYVYSHLGERGLFFKLLNQSKSFSAALSADQMVEQMYLESKVEINHTISARKEYLAKVDTILEEMGKLWREAQSFSSFNYYYILSIWAQELKGNFEQIVDLTSNSERLLQENNINSERFDHRYNKYIQIYAHLRAKDLQRGLELASSSETDFNPTSNNWFAFMENYFLLAMHSRKYSIAHSVMHKVLGNQYLSKLNKMAQERWVLYEAYLHFMSPLSGQAFKWQNLVQNLPSYSRDKEGFNVAILILQVMYYLETVDLEALEYRIEALKKYAHKHFKDSFSERSRAFFRLLTIMVSSGFDASVSQRKGSYLYQKLQRINPPGDAYAEIEIIPYEHLWEFMLKYLQKL